MTLAGGALKGTFPGSHRDATQQGNDLNEYVPLWCGRTIGHLTVGDFAVTGVPLFSVCVSSELLKDEQEGRKPMAWHFPV